MIRKVTIYGERCSGTNYLEELLVANFDVEIVCDYGWKHFFGFNSLENSDDVLFIGIVRDLVDWLNSFYNMPHHLPPNLKKSTKNFLNNKFFSIKKDKTVRETDLNLYTKNVYKNIFEMRHTKNKFLVEDMPTLVKNYLLITYDQLTTEFLDTMNLIKSFQLPVKNNIEFPLNITYYKKKKNKIFENDKKSEPKKDVISRERILKKANLYYEKILFKGKY